MNVLSFSKWFATKQANTFKLCFFQLVMNLSNLFTTRLNVNSKISQKSSKAFRETQIMSKLPVMEYHLHQSFPLWHKIAFPYVMLSLLHSLLFSRLLLSGDKLSPTFVRPFSSLASRFFQIRIAEFNKYGKVFFLLILIIKRLKLVCNRFAQWMLSGSVHQFKKPRYSLWIRIKTFFSVWWWSVWCLCFLFRWLLDFASQNLVRWCLKFIARLGYLSTNTCVCVV